MRVILFLVLTASSVYYTECGICYSCEETDCSYYSVADCPYGVSKEQCGCCDVCSKGPGERCEGGEYWMGECGTGLRCQYDDLLPYEPGVCVWNQ